MTDIIQKTRRKSPAVMLWSLAALAAIALHVTCILFVPVADTFLNAWHLSAVMALGFSAPLVFANKQRNRVQNALDLALACAGFVTGIYFILNEAAVFERHYLTVTDQVIALAAVLLVLELTRRAVGWLIPAIAVIAIAYVLWLGPLFDGMFWFGGLSAYRMAFRVFWQDGALLGPTVTISATIIFMFVLLSSLMRFAGATDFIISGTMRLMRRIPGGSAHVAVLSSAAMGTVSGSAIANVTGTGTITIPLMKKAGLSRELAGGVEAAASTGSQLAPPIMGAGIFIMSDWIGVPYTELVLISIIPALLFFFSISFNIHLELKKAGLLKPVLEEDLPKPVGKAQGLAFLGPILLLIFLLTIGYSPVYSAAWTCGAVILCSFFTPNPLGPSRWLDIARDTMQTLLPTATVLICAGLIVVCLETSGLVVAMAQSLNALGHGQPLLILLLLAVISLFLGMGLPVTASYIVVASFGAAALTSLGIPPVAAHMAIFWLSQDSVLTPPVCLAAYAAAGISGGNPAKTGFKAMLLGKGLYLMPVMFVFHGLLFDQGVGMAIQATLVGTVAIAVFAIGVVGIAFAPLRLLERLTMGLSAILLLWPALTLQIVGAVIATLFLVLNYARLRATKRTEQTV